MSQKSGSVTSTGGGGGEQPMSGNVSKLIRGKIINRIVSLHVVDDVLKPESASLKLPPQTLNL